MPRRDGSCCPVYENPGHSRTQLAVPRAPRARATAHHLRAALGPSISPTPHQQQSVPSSSSSSSANEGATSRVVDDEGLRPPARPGACRGTADARPRAPRPRPPGPRRSRAPASGLRRPPSLATRRHGGVGLLLVASRGQASAVAAQPLELHAVDARVRRQRVHASGARHSSSRARSAFGTRGRRAPVAPQRRVRGHGFAQTRRERPRSAASPPRRRRPDGRLLPGASRSL